MTNNLAPREQTALSLPESAEQKRQRLQRWMMLNESTPLPERALEDAKLVLEDMDLALRSATAEQFSAQVMPCLMLCGGSGMHAHDRTEWIKAAAITLAGIPYDLLARGCDVARKYADHPSKIVPTIMREIETPWKNRKIERGELFNRMRPPQKAPWELAREDTFDPANRCKPEEAAAILKEHGLDQPVARDLDVGRDCSKLRQPTKEELEALAAEFKAAHATTPQQDGETQAA